MNTRSRNRKNVVATDDGGVMTISGDGRGGFVVTKTKGYKETPDERRARLEAGRSKARTIHDSRPRKNRTRKDAKKAAIRDSW